VRAVLSVAGASTTILRRHLARSVGGTVPFVALSSFVLVFVVSYNVLAHAFLHRFLPLGATGASSNVTAVLEALIAAQMISAAGLAVIVLVVSPGQSSLRTAVHVLAASRAAARVGETLPYLVVLGVSALALSVGPIVHVASAARMPPTGVVTVAALELVAALSVAVVAETTRLASIVVIRSHPSVAHVAAVLTGVAVVGVAMLDTLSSTREAEDPFVIRALLAGTGGRGLDGSPTSMIVVSAVVLILTGAFLAVRIAQPLEPLQTAHRILTLGWLPGVVSGWTGRELVLAIRQPLSQVSIAVSVVVITILGLAVRHGVLPIDAVTSIAGLLAAAPVELAWGRAAAWGWLYRRERVRATTVVAAQGVAGLVLASILMVVLHSAAGSAPDPRTSVHLVLLLLATVAIAEAAGVVSPADPDVPVSVAVTSVLAVSADCALMWCAARVDAAAPGWSDLVFAVAAILAAVAATSRLAFRLRPIAVH